MKVKRTDSTTGVKLELVFNVENVDPATYLWLRDGDVIEIPERDPNAPPRASEVNGSTAAPSIAPPAQVPVRQRKSP